MAAESPLVEAVNAALDWLTDPWHLNRILIVWVPFMAVAIAGAVWAVRSIR